MILPATRVNTRIPEHEARGLLLAFLSASMKANKTNQVKPLNFFLRERLKRREDRASLNVMLNALANQLARKGDGLKVRGSVLDSAANGSSTEVLIEMGYQMEDVVALYKESAEKNNELFWRVQELERQIQVWKNRVRDLPKGKT